LSYNCPKLITKSNQGDSDDSDNDIRCDDDNGDDMNVNAGFCTYSYNNLEQVICTYGAQANSAFHPPGIGK